MDSSIPYFCIYQSPINTGGYSCLFLPKSVPTMSSAYTIIPPAISPNKQKTEWFPLIKLFSLCVLFLVFAVGRYILYFCFLYNSLTHRI